MSALDDVLGAPTPNGNGGPPTVRLDDRHRYVIDWPAGRPPAFQLTSELFEAMVTDINEGRMAVEVLKAIADALGRLVPSTPAT